MSSEMKVTLIANASQSVSEIGKLQASANQTAQSFAQVTKAASEGAKAAAGSFQDLKARLGAARAELDRLAEGTPEFQQQAAAVKALNAEFAQAKQKIAELTAAEQAIAVGTAEIKDQGKAVEVAANSYTHMKEELKAAQATLSGLDLNSKEWQEQATVVAQLSQNLNQAENRLQGLVSPSTAAAGSLNALEKELKDNVEALKNLKAGSTAFDQQKAKVDALRNSLDEVNDSLKEAKPNSTWTETATAMGLATGAALELFQALEQVADAQDAVVSKGAATVVNLDTMARKMQIQAGLNDEQRSALTKEIIGQSSDAGVTAETGFRAATQLAGSGFNKAVETGALKTVLDTIQASSFTGGPEELVSAFTEALNAYGLEKTNENLQAIGIAAQGLFKSTDFQLTELADFAKNAAVFEGANLSLQQSMAAFTALREVLPAAESGTGLRNFVNILQGADATKESRETLSRLQLTPDQVDFVGEDLQQVIKTIREAAAKLPEEDQNTALIKLFGRENVASAKLLLKSPDRIAELEGLQQNRAQFATDRGVAVSSMQAARNRQGNSELLAQMPVADELNLLDLERRRRDAFFEHQKQVAAVKLGAVGTAMAEGVDIPLPLGLKIPIPGALSVGKSVDTVVGTPMMEQTSSGLLEVFKSFFRSKEEVDAQMKADSDKKHQEALEAANRQAALLQEVVDNQRAAGRAPAPRAPASRPVPLAPAAAAAAAAR